MEGFNPVSLDPCLRRGDEKNEFAHFVQEGGKSSIVMAMCWVSLRCITGCVTAVLYPLQVLQARRPQQHSVTLVR